MFEFEFFVGIAGGVGIDPSARPRSCREPREITQPAHQLDGDGA